MDLLLAIGAQQPEFLLTGKTLQDQGLAVAGLLVSGWTPEQVRQVIAGRKLPEPIMTSVGAIVSKRLEQAMAGPPPASALRWTQERREAAQTPTPAPWNADTVVPHTRRGECEGEQGMCGRPTEPGEAFCHRHAAANV